MKLSSRLAQAKRQRQVRQPAPGPAGPRSGKVRLRRWALIALCLVLAGCGTWAVLRYYVWPKVPSALVGTWEVTEGPMTGGTFAFSRNGTLAVHAEGQGKDYAVQAQVVVVGNVLLTISRDPGTGQEQTRKSTIRELTGTSLVLELENGQVLRMARKE
jgi:hypothetical protein